MDTELERGSDYRWLVLAAILIQIVSVAFGTWMAASETLVGWENLGLIMITGRVSGICINAAHGLGHKTGPLSCWAAKPFR